jgi:hypothetical protein
LTVETPTGADAGSAYVVSTSNGSFDIKSLADDQSSYTYAILS